MQRAHRIVEVVGEQDNVDGRVRWGTGVAEVAEVRDKGATSAAIWWCHLCQRPRNHGGGALPGRWRSSAQPDTLLT